MTEAGAGAHSEYRVPAPAFTVDARTPLRWATLAGVCGGVVTLGVWTAAYALGIGVFPPLDLVDAIIRYAPGDLDTWAIDTFGHSAQRLLTLISTLSFLAIAGCGGVLLRRSPSSRAGLIGGLVTLPLWIGLSKVADAWPTGFHAALATIALGLGLAWGGWLTGAWLLELDLLERERRINAVGARSWIDGSGTIERRAILRQMLGFGLVIGFGGVGARWFAGMSGVAAVVTSADLPLDEVRATVAASLNLSDLPAPTSPPELPESFDAPAGVRPRATSTSDFYVVDISTRDPALPELDWSLRVFGLVDQQLDIRWNDLLSMPSVELHGTLMCISYTHGSDLISNTRWTGVPLRDVLRKSGIGDGVIDLVLRGANGYSDSIPLAKALEPTTLLVYGMDGRTLPRRHGFPCRLYVAGLYGEKNVKWLESIELVDDDYLGYWQERGWTDIAIVNTISTIDTPSGAAARDESGTIAVGGIAFAGSRGISGVELQIDDSDWQAVEVEAYAPQLVWQRWRLDWSPEPGQHHLAVRAIDGDGVRQIETDSEPHPDGLTGLYRARVRIT